MSFLHLHLTLINVSLLIDHLIWKDRDRGVRGQLRGIIR